MLTQLLLYSLIALSEQQFQEITRTSGAFSAYYLANPTFTNITFRLCSNMTGWLGIGFNPSQSVMNGAQAYIATQAENKTWQVGEYLLQGHTLPSVPSGPGVSDVADASVDCYSTIGVSFVIQVTKNSAGISKNSNSPFVISAVGLTWKLGGHQYYSEDGQYTFVSPPPQVATASTIRLGDSITLQYVPNEAENTINFILCANITGWIGIGFNPSVSGMSGASILVFTRKSTWSVQSMYSPNYQTPEIISSEVYPTSVLTDATQKCASLAGVAWSRKIDSLVPAVHEFSLKGAIYIIYAWSSSNSFTYHGPNFGQTGKLKLVDASKIVIANSTFSSTPLSSPTFNETAVAAKSSARRPRWFFL